MKYRAQIPYGRTGATFRRWQGSFASLTRRVRRACRAQRNSEPRHRSRELRLRRVGLSGRRKISFYGLPWLTGMIGAKQAGGRRSCRRAPPAFARCSPAQGNRMRHGRDGARHELRSHVQRPPLYYPKPEGPGLRRRRRLGARHFGCDPLGRIDAAVAGVRREEARHLTAQQHEVVLMREEQYRRALATTARSSSASEHCH